MNATLGLAATGVDPSLEGKIGLRLTFEWTGLNLRDFSVSCYLKLKILRDRLNLHDDC
jgi:hypothetical protein